MLSQMNMILLLGGCDPLGEVNINQIVTALQVQKEAPGSKRHTMSGNTLSMGSVSPRREVRLCHLESYKGLCDTCWAELSGVYSFQPKNMQCNDCLQFPMLSGHKIIRHVSCM